MVEAARLYHAARRRRRWSRHAPAAGRDAAHRHTYDSFSPDDPEGQAAFSVRTGAAGVGWTVGRNVQIDYRWARAAPWR